jgi:hypothetical protein
MLEIKVKIDHSAKNEVDAPLRVAAQVINIKDGSDE